MGAHGVKIKICGLSRECDIEAVNNVLPDFAGFVLVEGSKRYVSAVRAGQLIGLLDRRIKSVLVTANEDADKVVRAASLAKADMVQLHGSENDDYIRYIKRSGPEVIKAYNVADKMPTLTAAADYVLIDGAKGGGGVPFDWRLLEGYDLSRVLLAGGINIDNISTAAKHNPYAIDVSGGAERGGYKDADLISNLVKAVRQHGI